MSIMMMSPAETVETSFSLTNSIISVEKEVIIMVDTIISVFSFVS